MATMNSTHEERSRRRRARADGPPPLTPVDMVIRRHNGSSSAIEATRERLQASKKQPGMNCEEELVSLQKRNGCLRRELAFHRELAQPYEELFIGMGEVSMKMNMLLLKFGKARQKAEEGTG